MIEQSYKKKENENEECTDAVDENVVKIPVDQLLLRNVYLTKSSKKSPSS